jgi:hypothetical protein
MLFTATKEETQFPAPIIYFDNIPIERPHYQETKEK